LEIADRFLTTKGLPTQRKTNDHGRSKC